MKHPQTDECIISRLIPPRRWVQLKDTFHPFQTPKALISPFPSVSNYGDFSNYGDSRAWWAWEMMCTSYSAFAGFRWSLRDSWGKRFEKGEDKAGRSQLYCISYDRVFFLKD